MIILITVIFMLIGLTAKMQSALENSFKKTLGEAILKNFEKRSVKLFENDILISALYLDPRFHQTLSNHQKQNAIAYLKKKFGINLCHLIKIVPLKNLINN